MTENLPTTQPDTSTTQDLFFSQQNIDYVMKSVQELRKGKGTVHELIDVVEQEP